jgi:hypothetical protein
MVREVVWYIQVGSEGRCGKLTDAPMLEKERRARVQPELGGTPLNESTLHTSG